MYSYCGPTLPPVHNLNNIVYTHSEDLCILIWLNLHGLFVLEKIFKYISYTYRCKNLIPFCDPILSPAVMIWTILNLNSIGKLSHKFWPFCPGGVLFFRRVLKDASISWFFVRKMLNPLYPRMRYDKFCWNWSCRSGEIKMFKCLKSLPTVWTPD